MHLINRDAVQEWYDFYVKQYNELKNPIPACADLLTIKNGLHQRLEDLKENVNLYIDDIEFYLKEILDSTISSNGDKTDDLMTTNNNDLKEHITESIREQVHESFHISLSDNFINHYSQ